MYFEFEVIVPIRAMENIIKAIKLILYCSYFRKITL